jgi:hypothetical protein
MFLDDYYFYLYATTLTIDFYICYFCLFCPILLILLTTFNIVSFRKKYFQLSIIGRSEN